MKLTTIAAAAALAVASMSASAATYVPGTYTYKVNAHNAAMTVAVTVSKHKIEKIDWSKNLETIGVGRVALDIVSKKILDHQSVGVDAVTGATISSFALMQGVKDCLKQAGGDMTALTKHVEQHPAVEAKYQADVVVVGGGGAGLAAAISAYQAGAKHVLVLEKLGFVGGSTNVSEGALNAVDPVRQGRQGIEDSVAKFYDQTIKGGHNKGTPALVHYLTENSMNSVDWLEDLGVKFKDEIGTATGALWQRSHYPATPSGNTYIRSFEDFQAAHADQLLVLNDVQATDLILDDAGAVVGVKGLFKGDQEVTVNAKAVIIATGGFGANVEYRQSVNDGVWKEVVLDETIGCTNIQPCAQGEGMALALGAGAERDVLCKNIFAQPDGTYWIVVNTLRYPDPDEPDANGATINNMLALGHIVAGDTVEALAGEMGVDAANLQASIDAYNAVVEGGTDEFGFVADNTADAAMTEGPWYACRKVPTVHHTMGGIRVNVESEACNADGEPIPGLYAAGECTGGIHGENRLGGNAIADCMTFGRNAGTNAAKYALA